MVNRMRTTSSKRNSRRSHHKVANPALSKDSKGTLHQRHRVSPTSGLYKGRQVLDVEKKALKKAQKNQDNTEDK